MIDITPVTPQDRDEWARLWQGYLTFYKTELDEATSAATFERVSTPGSGIHAAFARDEAGRAIGLVQWLTHPATWTTADYCYLEDLFVDPEARGSGAGSALIEHVRSWAAEHGSAKVYWLTAEDNETARALYDRVAECTGFIQYAIPR